MKSAFDRLGESLRVEREVTEPGSHAMPDEIECAKEATNLALDAVEGELAFLRAEVRRLEDEARLQRVH